MLQPARPALRAVFSGHRTVNASHLFDGGGSVYERGIFGIDKLLNCFGEPDYLYFWVMGERSLADLNLDNVSLRLIFRLDVVIGYAELGLAA
jgi:hypothetical protein